MRNLFIFIFSGLGLLVNSQTLNDFSKTIIADSFTKQPISFPQIYLHDLSLKYGNLNGEINTSEIFNKKIVINSLGYLEKVIEVYDKIDTIFLQPKSYELPSVTILSKIYNEKFVGNFKKNLKKSTFKAFIGSKVVYFISGVNNTGIIKEIFIPIQKPKKNNYVRVLLMSVDENGYPDENILQENIVLATENIPKSLSLEQFRIQIPNNGIYLGIEWLSNELPNKFITAEAPSILANWTSEICNTYQLLPKINQKWHKIDYKNSKSKCLNIAVGLKIIQL